MSVRLSVARACTAVAVIGVSLSLVAASPAGAATTVSKAKVVKALVSADELGPKWHKTSAGSSGSGSVMNTGGCSETFEYKSVGLEREVERTFQFAKTALVFDETIQVFGSAAQAKADFTKGVATFAKCTSWTVDGKPWTVTRISSPKYADQRAKYRMTGTIAAASGDVTVTTYIVVTRHGKHETVASLIVGGNGFTAAEQRTFSAGATRGSKLATAKVAAFLGR